jgi:hypothetical protein
MENNKATWRGAGGWRRQALPCLPAADVWRPGSAGGCKAEHASATSPSHWPVGRLHRPLAHAHTHEYPPQVATPFNTQTHREKALKMSTECGTGCMRPWQRTRTLELHILNDTPWLAASKPASKLAGPGGTPSRRHATLADASPRVQGSGDPPHNNNTSAVWAGEGGACRRRCLLLR